VLPVNLVAWPETIGPVDVYPVDDDVVSQNICVPDLISAVPAVVNPAQSIIVRGELPDDRKTGSYDWAAAILV
jgi:hypothetical protein